MRRILVVAAVSAACIVFVGNAASAKDAGLSNKDCVKCHPGPPAAIKEAGGAHGEAVGCQDCHNGHPPTTAKKDMIPKCSDCHDGEEHFALKGCLGCHTNPHMPKRITFAKNVTGPCLTCHKEQIAQLTDFKSKHTRKDCSYCHDEHGKKPACLSCHKGHNDEMKTCGGCHKAHMPTQVTYVKTTPSAQCGACHSKAYSQLQASATKHKNLSCAHCHENKHRTVPECKDCHGAPHPAGIMARFPRCGDCHKIAHDLNNWTVASTSDKPERRGRKR